MDWKPYIVVDPKVPNLQKVVILNSDIHLAHS